jgi:multisubunit Na+/H+ antiporter MnhB subunit
MGFRRITDIVLGVAGVLFALLGFLINENPLPRWVTKLFRGEKNIPAWVGSSFYLLLGLLLLYWGFTQK